MTKSGIALSASVIEVIVRSRRPFSRVPIRMPRATASGTTTARVANVSTSVAPTEAFTMSRTGPPLISEVPRSPVSTLPNQCVNLSSAG